MSRPDLRASWTHTLLRPRVASGFKRIKSSFAPGKSRRLPVPGFELTSTHSDAWGLSAATVMLVIGAGNTGVQVASIFHAFGTSVQLFEAGPRIFVRGGRGSRSRGHRFPRSWGIVVRENFGESSSSRRRRQACE